MVEQQTVAAIHPVAFAVVHRDPVAVKLCHPVGTSRIERGALSLRCLLHETIELACAGLIDTCFLR